MRHNPIPHIFLSLTLVLASGLVHSQSLMVSPKRIVLDEKHRSDVVKLFNNSNDTMSYTVKWQHFQMLSDGQYLPIDSVRAEDHPADSLVRYYPPEITLAPHESQIVRLRFLKPPHLASAEYRSHLSFAGVERGTPVEWTVHDTLTNRVKIAFKPLWGVSIPVLVRNDTVPATVSIDSLVLIPPDTGRNVYLSFNLNRSGIESCYGSIAVKHRDPAGLTSRLFLLKNVAVFPPLETRRLILAFKIPENIDLRLGNLAVEYLTATDGPEQIQASSQLALGK